MEDSSILLQSLKLEVSQLQKYTDRLKGSIETLEPRQFESFKELFAQEAGSIIEKAKSIQSACLGRDYKFNRSRVEEDRRLKERLTSSSFGNRLHPGGGGSVKGGRSRRNSTLSILSENFPDNRSTTQEESTSPLKRKIDALKHQLKQISKLNRTYESTISIILKWSDVVEGTIYDIEDNKGFITGLGSLRDFIDNCFDDKKPKESTSSKFKSGKSGLEADHHGSFFSSKRQNIGKKDILSVIEIYGPRKSVMKKKEKINSHHSLNLQIRVDDRLSSNSEVGGAETHFAMKAKDSFIIATKDKDVILIENGQIIYTGRPRDDKVFTVKGIAYAKLEDCYFLYSFSSKTIFRKRIDNLDPEPWTSIVLSGKLMYTGINQGVVDHDDDGRMVIVSTTIKNSGLRIKQKFDRRIMDYDVYGEKEDMMVAVTWSGWVILYNYDLVARRGDVMGAGQLELLKERDENPIRVCVGPKGKYICVHLEESKFPFVASRFIILELDQKNSNILQMSVFHLFDQSILRCLAVECFGYVGKDYLIFSALSTDQGVLLTLEYDVVKREVNEIKRLRKEHGEMNPLRLLKVGRSFYAVGENAKVLQIKYD